MLQNPHSDLQNPPVIGVLDSGVGGLSVLREIHALLPAHSLTYLGDSAWCPYGNKPFSEIRDRVFTLSDRLIDEGAEAIVIACNSATIAAIDALRQRYDIPFIGMEPGVKPAAEQTRTGVIGVLATEASLSGEKFQRLVAQHCAKARVISRPCPNFVMHVEAGILDGPEVAESISEYTAEMIAQGADVIILGCTHYPFLKDAITRCLPPGTRLIDTGPAVARRVAEHHLRCDTPPVIRLHTTGPLDELKRLVPILCPGLKVDYQPFELS